MNNIKVGNRRIGNNEPCFIVAEIGINHNGDMELAKKLIDSAAESGADAVKFQTLDIRSISFLDRDKKWDGKETIYELVKRTCFTKKQHKELQTYCKTRSVIFFSTAASKRGVDLLVDLNVPLLKYASCFINDLDFLEYHAKTKIPIIVSTGMSSLGDIEDAINILEKQGSPYMLLECTSLYPTKPDDIDLNKIKTLKKAFGGIVGFSDHTLTPEISIGAVALGAKIIERHFTLDQNMPGPDQKISINPEQFKRMTEGIRNVEKALGSGKKNLTKNEQEFKPKFMYSIAAKGIIKKGETLSKNKLTISRPGTGINPKHMKYVLGRVVNRDIPKGEVIRLEYLNEK